MIYRCSFPRLHHPPVQQRQFVQGQESLLSNIIRNSQHDYTKHSSGSAARSIVRMIPSRLSGSKEQDLTTSSHIVTAVQTGLSYDVGQLSPKSLTNAREGLSDNRMSMVRCYEHDNKFHFELQERVCVTIHDKRVPTCSTCPHDEGRACRHIWWVDDQILSTAVGPEARSQYQYQISHGGQAVREPKEKETLMFYAWLKEKNLEKLARHAGWWKQDPTNQQDTRLVEHTATHILSTFEPCGVLPRQHGQENFEMLQRESQ